MCDLPSTKITFSRSIKIFSLFMLIASAHGYTSRTFQYITTFTFFVWILSHNAIKKVYNAFFFVRAHNNFFFITFFKWTKLSEKSLRLLWASEHNFFFFFVFCEECFCILNKKKKMYSIILPIFFPSFISIPFVLDCT